MQYVLLVMLNIQLLELDKQTCYTRSNSISVSMLKIVVSNYIKYVYYNTYLNSMSLLYNHKTLNKNCIY